MKPISMTELCVLTSMDHTTISARINAAGLTVIGTKGKARLYESNAALRAIYAPDKSRTAGLTPSEKLAMTRHEIAELELAEKRGELVRAEVVVASWEKTFATIRARLLALPTKLAALLAPPGKLQQTEAKIAAEVDQVLTELADGKT